MDDDVQTKLAELQEKGWTLANIARELGQAIVTVESWKAGKRSPAIYSQFSLRYTNY